MRHKRREYGPEWWSQTLREPRGRPRVVGTHAGKFAGLEATGHKVDVPLAVFYTVEDRGITEGRAWFMVSTMLEQVT